MKKIDELMATEVRGWKLHDGYIWTGEYKTDSCSTDAREVWSPSTDMNQAMECLHNYLDTAPKNCTPLIWYNSTSDMWVVEIKHTDVCEYATYKEIPLAICKAILKAKGVEYEQ